MKKASWTCALLVGVLLGACADETGPSNGGDEGEPPVLPDVGSLLFDIDFFTNPAPSAGAHRSVPGLHWTTAAINVGVANFAMIVHLAVPVLTWRAAILQSPVLEEARWHWRFTTSEGGETYSGDLAGFVQGGDAVFEMRITATILGLTDFLWYTGRAPIGGTVGEWEFFDPNAQGTVVGRIEWSHPSEDAWTLTFIAASGANVGDELTYVVDGTSRTVSYSDASTGNTVEIGWDQMTREGYIIAPNYNGGMRSCWDGMLENAVCP